ncbi:DEAD/DEAH box helicase [Weeksellaceae bacterium KMM 9713]|uniref:DEAD/DEAH box helicase n=1 Tax=Profundicola chukchiensis TaxID=2961959 RepID=A0A9X4MY66_9FLAO|nr:DEAD/DEAH box helicase [Profundicola chukchiensis]MDG4945697.1 DEAD/DEAH box helicase [Profundicola chukchiensis]
MNTFDDFKIKKQLVNALSDLGISKPTPIQSAAYAPIKSGRDFVGIAQTGTGKTFAYLLPIIQDLSYSEQPHPRVLILVPTRELVIQTVKEIEKLTPYIHCRVEGVYGGTNMNTQKKAIAQGVDVVVGTPQRLYDLAMTNVLRLNSIKKLVIDEVDIMLDFGFRTQLRNIFSFLPQKRQNILFSATMTTYVDEMIRGFLINPLKETISISGTPLENISQSSYQAANFYTKANLLNYLLSDEEKFSKVLIFVSSKIKADRLYETLDFQDDTSLIHARKTQSHRMHAIENFVEGKSRILIATDVISRGIDIDKIDTVISFDVPRYPENYIHRIGRTGRAEHKGNSILLFSEAEMELKTDIENLMNYQIPLNEFPAEVEVSRELTPEEEDKPKEEVSFYNDVDFIPGASFHEKAAKNKKSNAKRKSYGDQMKEKFKKPIRRGDKIQNLKKKKRKR